MSETTKANMIVPEVIAAMIDTNLGAKLVFGAVAVVDDTLQGQPGDTIKFPSFEYIGAAGEVAENGEVPMAELKSSTKPVTVKKYAKSVGITDEARLSGYGDPVGEAARQLSYSIDHATDNDMLAKIKAAPFGRFIGVTAMSANNVSDALQLYGENLDGEKLLYTSAEKFNQLRKDPNFIKASDMGQRMINSGVVGEIHGCQIMISDRIKRAADLSLQSYIIKPGALRQVRKASTNVEVVRVPKYMKDEIYVSQHSAAYLYDESKLIVIEERSALKVLAPASYPEIKITTESASKYLEMPGNYIPSAAMKWVYVMSDSTSPAGTFGTALAGSRDYVPGSALVTGGKTYAHIYLADSDLKPYFVITLAIPA